MKWKFWEKEGQIRQGQDKEQQEQPQGKLKATPAKKNNLPPYLTQGILTSDNELRREIEEYLNSYKESLNKLNREKFALLIDNIYNYSLNAEKNTRDELFNLILKLIDARGDRREIIDFLNNKELKQALRRVDLIKKTSLTADDLIKVLSLMVGNQPQNINRYLANIEEPLLRTALLIEFKERGLNVDEYLYANLYDELSKKLGSIEGKNADEIISFLIRNKLNDEEKKIFDSLEGATIEEKIKNAKDELKSLKNAWTVPTESESKKLGLLPDLIKKLENELKQINNKDVIAYYHVAKAIEELSEKRKIEFFSILESNRPFDIEFLKNFLKRVSFVGGGIGGVYLLSYFFGPTENPFTNMLIFGGGIGSTAFAISEAKSALKKLREIEGWRGKVRVARRDIFWTVAGIGGLAFAVYSFVNAKDEQEKRVLGEFLKAIGLSKDGKNIDENAIKEQLGITTRELELLIEFYSSEQGKNILAYLSGTINKNIEISKTFDIDRLKEGLEKDNLGAFRPSKWLTALIELQKEMKNRKDIKEVVKNLLPKWKQEGYLFNSAQTILFEYGRVLGFDSSELESIITNKESAKNFADVVDLVYKGKLPQSVAYLYYDLKYRENNEEEAEKLLLSQSIQKRSVMEYFDRYTLYILLDPSKSQEEKTQALNNFKNTLEVYNKSERIRNSLSQEVGDGAIVYGYVHGYISDKIQDSPTNATSYYIADSILAMIDKRFLDEVELVKFASEYGIIEWLKGKIKDNKIGVINLYNFVKELQNDSVFKGMNEKDRHKWLDEQLEKGLYKKYKGWGSISPTYNNFGIEIASGLPAKTEKKETTRGRAPTTTSVGKEEQARPPKKAESKRQQKESGSVEF